MKSIKGFTLIELIIVISIVSTLALISVTSFLNIQKRARDAKRIADINEMIRAITTYHLQTGEYPGEATTTGSQISSQCPNDLTDDLLAQDVINSIPSDPKSANVRCDPRSSHTGSDDWFFYGWDSTHCCDYSYCISINKLETEWGLNQLIQKHGQRQMVDGGGDANIGTGGEMQFNYCFVPN